MGTCSDFHLTIDEGQFTDSEILVMLGQNGTGKTTFIRMLAGLMKSDGEDQVPELNVSYKPQKISPKFDVCNFFFLHRELCACFSSRK